MELSSFTIATTWNRNGLFMLPVRWRGCADGKCVNDSFAKTVSGASHSRFGDVEWYDSRSN